MLYHFVVDTLCVKSEAEIIGMETQVCKEFGTVRNEVVGVDDHNVGQVAADVCDHGVDVGDGRAEAADLTEAVAAPDGGDGEYLSVGIHCRESVVKLGAELTDEVLKNTVEAQDYKVTGIE